MPPAGSSPARGAAGPEGPVESVTQYTQRIKALLEHGLPSCWVRGEVSNLKIQSSGHVYFSVKDAGAQLSAVMFRGDALRQETKLRDGMQVLVRGDMSVYEPRGQYQMIVRAVLEDGVGRLQREFEELKARLSAEGLFAPENKVPIPPMPATVGFITSPTGAAVRDFIRILERRGWRGRVVVLPCKVQGVGAADEMTAMLEFVHGMRRSPDGRPMRARSDVLLPGFEEAPYFFDLLVIGRGGGSLEDLWAFNEEVLVRAVAASRIPIVSAVGHEIDFTLCDFAADRRAETPSGAAELVSSHFVAACERVERLGSDLNKMTQRHLADSRLGLGNLRGRLRLLSPSAQIERGYLRLDDLSNRLFSALRHTLSDRRRRLDTLASAIARKDPAQRVQLGAQRLDSLRKRLEAASPHSVVRRGFVIMRDEQGQPVQKAAGLRKGETLQAEFSDANVALKVVSKPA